MLRDKGDIYQYATKIKHLKSIFSAFTLQKSLNKMKKYAFIDRDGTIIFEPKDTFQVEHLSHLYFITNVISSLKELQKMGYTIVIVSNQDGLGTVKNPLENYNKINSKVLDILQRMLLVVL